MGIFTYIYNTNIMDTVIYLGTKIGCTKHIIEVAIVKPPNFPDFYQSELDDNITKFYDIMKYNLDLTNESDIREIIAKYIEYGLDTSMELLFRFGDAKVYVEEKGIINDKGTIETVKFVEYISLFGKPYTISEIKMTVAELKNIIMNKDIIPFFDVDKYFISH